MRLISYLNYVKKRNRHHGYKGYFGDLLVLKNRGIIHILINNMNGIGFVGKEKIKETLKMAKKNNLVSLLVSVVDYVSVLNSVVKKKDRKNKY